MFHRRLLLLATGTLAGVAVLGTQLVRLSVVEGADRREAAESRLREHRFINTYRGRILDRDGNILARDRAADAVAVRYDVITEAWELRQASSEARREHGRTRWSEMSPEQREAAIGEHLPHFEAQTRRLWDAVLEYGRIDEGELARRRAAIKRDVQSTAEAVWRRHFLQELTESRGEDGEVSLRQEPIREQRQTHVILPEVSPDVAYVFRRLAEDLDGIVEVKYAPFREYPWSSVDVRLDRDTLPEPVRDDEPFVTRVDGVADHMLGAVRTEIWEEDVRRRPFRDPESGEIDLGWYRPGDVVGTRGLEAAFEDHLRGLRGMVRERRDTGAAERTEPVPGSDLYTTLDIRLQAKVQAMLSPEYGLTRVQQWQAGWDNDGEPRESRLPVGTPLNSAAVVLDVESGHVLSMVSWPTMAMGRQMSSRRRELDQPWVNRASEAVYPPGSILKPLVAIAAAEEAVADYSEPIHCGGHYFEGLRDAARCWIYRPPAFHSHGDLMLEEAMARSCNIFFYTLGDRLGMEAMSRWLELFGIGRYLDAGLGYSVTGADGRAVLAGESRGSVPGERVIEQQRRLGQERFSSVILGIGQGPVAWTPLQAANAYATLARRGRVQDASLLITDPRETTERREHGSLDLGVLTVDRIMEGLRQSVMESYGTGYAIRYPDGTSEPIINAEGVTVWAKTGTAQAPPLRMPDPDDPDGEPVVVTDGSHAWFVGLVGSESYGRPQYAIAVLVEYGGSGGRTAGPIANQIIRVMQDEGYLPGGGS